MSHQPFRLSAKISFFWTTPTTPVLHSLFEIHNTPLLHQQGFEACLASLPARDREKALAYYHQRDAQAFVLGRQLLHKALLYLGYEWKGFEHILYGETGKPYLEDGPYFNISHSGHCIGCIVSEHPVGLDLEEKRTIPVEDFKGVFTAEEWDWIQMDQERFYTLWTRKEALLKATGSGFSFSPARLSVLGLEPLIENTRYFLKEVLLAGDYSCHACSTVSVDELRRFVVFCASPEWDIQAIQ